MFKKVYFLNIMCLEIIIAWCDEKAKFYLIVFVNDPNVKIFIFTATYSFGIR